MHWIFFIRIHLQENCISIKKCISSKEKKYEKWGSQGHQIIDRMPSHYLNQYWLTLNWTPKNYTDWKINYTINHFLWRKVKNTLSVLFLSNKYPLSIDTGNWLDSILDGLFPLKISHHWSMMWYFFFIKQIYHQYLPWTMYIIVWCE